ncbi:hypothetical protein [Variovorax sp.]|uniref:hypothetical protein n=1 Tax=Variovorax sp. TaxID=1871043 RepID=UPI002D439D39|nr:hypothetical protein [Variovorax sp.]HYP82800.1 hypothetical protein [Variovorax sp.]
MTITKSEVVSVRVPPDVKAALITAAGLERRSLASMVEFMVLEYCKTRSIPLDTEGAAATLSRRKARSRADVSDV